MNNAQNQKKQELEIKVDNELLKGSYATMAQISHGSEEFVLDFINHIPPVGQLVSRIIVSPSHFKRLVNAMQGNLENYEKQFGTISLAVVPDQQIGFRVE